MILLLLGAALSYCVLGADSPALRAAEVERLMLDGDRYISRRVPGSFLELISRARLDDGRLDLAFDAQNAQGIFKMTDGAAQ